MRTRPLRHVGIAIAAVLLTASLALAATIAHDLTGKWDFEVVTENGTGTPTLTFKQVGEKLTGTYESRMLGTRALEGSVKGDSLRFVLANTSDPNAITLTYVGLIMDKDNVKGSVDFGGMGSATFTGTRQKKTSP